MQMEDPTIEPVASAKQMLLHMVEDNVETQTVDNAISEAEEEYESTGILLDARDTLASLRRKHFD